MLHANPNIANRDNNTIKCADETHSQNQSQGSMAAISSQLCRLTTTTDLLLPETCGRIFGSRQLLSVGCTAAKSMSASSFSLATKFIRSKNCNLRVGVIDRSVTVRSSNGSPGSDQVRGDSSDKTTPFGYTRKDVLLIGVGVTAFGVGLKSGLEQFLGVDPLLAGNVVQLVVVLGLTVGWISTYMFRVSNKEMTYAQQLRDYESKVMEKRLESLTEAELEALLEQVDEEKRRLS